jgi:hypothetical protein
MIGKTNYPKGPLTWFSDPKDFTGGFNKGRFTTETIQRFEYGTRYLTRDGRVFKYGHATAECQSGYGAANYALCNISAVLAADAAEGDTTVKVTVTSGGYAASGVIAENELAGGYLILNNGVEDPQNFLILGNDASVSATTCLIHLDGPLWQAVTTSGYCEVLDNPYAHLYGGITIGSNGFVSFMGIPCRNLAATYNGWIQTWGPCWITPSSSGSSSPGYSAGDRECFFLAQGNGSIISGTGATVETGNQHCGFIINRSETTAGGPPLVMLQISI